MNVKRDTNVPSFVNFQPFAIWFYYKHKKILAGDVTQGLAFWRPSNIRKRGEREGGGRRGEKRKEREGEKQNIT
jgi:hypothetical protein